MSKTSAGRRKVIAATPGHVANVRSFVLDALSPTQQALLREIAEIILDRLDPTQSLAAHARHVPVDSST